MHHIWCIGDILKLQKCSKVSLLLSTEWWYLRRSKRKRGARFKWIRQAGAQWCWATLTVYCSSAQLRAARARRHLPANQPKLERAPRSTKFAHLSTTLNFWAQFWARYHLRTPTAAVAALSPKVQKNHCAADSDGGRIYFHLSIFNLKMSTELRMRWWAKKWLWHEALK